MSENHRLQLSIRQKIILGLIVSLLSLMLVGGLSFSYLKDIETKQRVVALADDLSNIILEVRRYEKNYLLYGFSEDLRENRAYLRQAAEYLAGMLPEIKTLSIAPEINRLDQQLRAYSGYMENRAACTSACADLEEQVRESGKSLVELSLLLVRIERERILHLPSSLERQLLFSVVFLLGMGGVFVFFVGAKIIAPLRTIEKTTLRIAGGDFTPLPVRRSNDETQRIMEAFNRMIAELARRQEQLVQAQKLSSIGILSSGIAHQLNNPLNNISTSLQILVEEFGQGDPGFMRRLLENCGQEILRAQEIVKGLLEFSRQKDFTLRPTTLAEVVEGAIRLISSQVPAGIEIRQDIPRQLQLDADGQRLQEVLLNLLMNATQAIEELPGEIRITARAASDAAGNPLVELVVADTGKGIAAPDVSRIFDPFFTTKEVGVGTGLGLSIVYGIIEKHQGTIAVESRPGEGTRFIIRLPVSQTVEPMRGTA